jgi:proteasome assembly chaperone (PAC2) family protein
VDVLRLTEIPSLRNPALILSFAGWNDAGQAATGAARFLIATSKAERLGDIDPEEFFNFTEQRPFIRLTDGLLRELDWPENAFYVARTGGPRDLIVLVGVEPHLRWRAFTDAVAELVSRCGVTMIVSLGGLLADVPHTRPVRVSGMSTDEEMLRRLEGIVVTGSRYEGPTGIVGVLTDRFRKMGMNTASLWANVPHYVTVPANPKATLALLERLDAMFDLDLDLRELRQTSERFEAEISEAVAADANAASYVRGLEEQIDAEEPAGPARPLPSGESVVREREEFLRRSRSNPEGDEPRPEDRR